MLDALGVGLRRLGRHAERAQEIDHEAMAHAHPVGERMALFGQEHAAVRPRRRQAGTLEPRDGLDRGGVGDAETAGDVGRPRLALAGLIGGSVVVERIFAWPGIGNLMIQAVEERDFPVVQAIALVYAIAFIGLNTIVDLLYIVADPRLRKASA